jgi:hypothetical protein
MKEIYGAGAVNQIFLNENWVSGYATGARILVNGSRAVWGTIPDLCDGNNKESRLMPGKAGKSHCFSGLSFSPQWQYPSMIHRSIKMMMVDTQPPPSFFAP